MAGYIVLGKYSTKMLGDIKTVEQPIAASKTIMKDLGIKFVGYWMAMGEYDCVIVVDAPDDLAMATFALIVGKSGLGTTQTMRAFSEKEIPEILAKLP